MDKEVATLAAENNWQLYRRKPGIGTYALAGIIFIVPKIGPLKLVAVKGPTEETETEYLHSVVLSTAALRQGLASFTPPSNRRSATANAISRDTHQQTQPADSASPVARSSRDPLHPLPNRDLDTGYVVKPGGYPLTDSTYADLLHRLVRSPAQPIPPGIKADIQSYYADPAAPIATKKDSAAWTQVQADLATLASMSTSTEPAPVPNLRRRCGRLRVKPFNTRTSA